MTILDEIAKYAEERVKKGSGDHTGGVAEKTGV